MRLSDALDGLSCGRKIRVVPGLVVMSLVVVTLANCTRSPEPVRVHTQSARESYALALEHAQRWKSDAYLTHVSVSFLVEGSSRQILLFYDFESPSDEHHSLQITFREGSTEPEVKTLDHSIPIQTRNPISTEDWPLDSVDVLGIAQENGGDEFLARHDPESTLTSLYLERLAPIVPGASLVWRASYLDLATRDRLDIIMDPCTGEISEITREP